ncbi:DUF393 domain-containing protein [Alphaproteobacteria bacterium]|jgi:predicted DCC family thiol-disulfide oxidoreductase YuxK|nr:DUF393 domain-containing protein [Alphaproteobacteria bacterium]
MKLIQVFYDGKCGLCSKEINYYKKISPQNIFKWNDIANNPDDLKVIKVSQYDALMYLHALDRNKNLKIGVDAFILIWDELKLWNLLSFFVKLPIIYQITKLLYNMFASYRFKKLTHCQMASQEVYK